MLFLKVLFVIGSLDIGSLYIGSLDICSPQTGLLEYVNLGFVLLFLNFFVNGFPRYWFPGLPKNWFPGQMEMENWFLTQIFGSPGYWFSLILVPLNIGSPQYQFPWVLVPLDIGSPGY